MSATLRFGDKSFDGPFEISAWAPPARAGIFCVVVPEFESYRPIYFGESSNFIERAFPAAKRGRASWLKIADYGASVLVAAYWMPRSTADERKAVERELIELYEPECNELARRHPLLIQ